MEVLGIRTVISAIIVIIVIIVLVVIPETTIIRVTAEIVVVSLRESVQAGVWSGSFVVLAGHTPCLYRGALVGVSQN